MSELINIIVNWLNSIMNSELTNDRIYILNNSYEPLYEKEDILNRLYQLIWITYRKNFEEINNYTNDIGWGCMIRTTQMLVGEGLIRESNKSNITKLFKDDINSELSIHNMLINNDIGKWYGPTETSYMISRCLNKLDYNTYIESSGILYKSEIRIDKPLFIFIILRLGLDNIDENFKESLLRCFEIESCIGIIGGKPSSSYYFYGYQNDNLLYLDPHIVQESKSPEYKCEIINLLNYKKLDPSLCVGFFIKNEKELNNFYENISKVINLEYSIFNIKENKVNYNINFKKQDDWEFIVSK